MPLTGNLADFPLPEVLIMIAQRTGRLKLVDVPFLGHVEIDFENGEVQAMYVGRETLVDIEHMVANLSAVVQMKKCQFEFATGLVKPFPRETPVTITQLVMALVCYVDEQLERQKEIDATRDSKRLVTKDVLRKTSHVVWAANVNKEIQRMTGRMPQLKPPQ